MTDTERLDWLERKGQTLAAGLRWICRNSTTGRGFRLHQIRKEEAEFFGDLSPSPTARAAIDAAMKAEVDAQHRKAVMA